MSDELERALDRATALAPELREMGRRELDFLFQKGSSAAGIGLAHLVLSESWACSLAKPEAVTLLVREVRLSSDPSALWSLYYHAGDLVSDDLMGELLALVAPNSAEAEEILEARLPGWRHPFA